MKAVVVDLAPQRGGCVLAWLCAAFAVVCFALPALAAVTFPTPAGWSRGGSASAQSRAEGWSEAAGGTVQLVLTHDDNPDELIAVLDLPGSMPPDALSGTDEASQSAALLYDAQAVLGIELPPTESGRVEPGLEGTAVLHGRWTVDDEAFYLAVGPTGRNHVAVVMVLEEQTRVLYESVFPSLLPQLRGLAPPLQPFPRGRWNTTAWIVWLLVGVTVIALTARIGDPTWNVAGTRAAGILAALGLVVGAVVFVSLGDREAELVAAGVSTAWMSLEVVAPAFVLAVAAVIGGRILDSRRGPVSSAPTAGTFARNPSQVPTVPEMPTVAPPGAHGATEHIEARPTPIVGVPILPPDEVSKPVVDDRPKATSGTLGSSPPPPPATPSALARHGTAELPASLVVATEIDPDAPGTPVADAPGRPPEPVGTPPPQPPEPPEPPEIGSPELLPGESGKASLATEQILIRRGRSFTKKRDT